MDENNIPEENGTKKEPVAPTVEYLPDLNGEEEAADNAPAENTAEKTEVSLPGKTENNGKTAAVPLYTRGIPTGVFITVLILAVVATFMTTFVCLSSTFRRRLSDYQTLYAQSEQTDTALQAKLKAVDSEIRSAYLYDIDEEALSDSVLKGYMWGIGDKYAEYFNKEEMDELIADSNAQMQGIGVSVTYNADEGAIQVINVFPDSPAGKAGVLPGDLIAYVKEDGEYVSVASLGYTVALSKLRGEAGTTAEFAVYRESSADPVEFSIERGYVTEYTVSCEFSETDKTVGIINISSFDSKTPEQFRKALDELISGGAEKLVFDVRNNPGGELDSVCAVLDMLLPEGPVIRTVDRDGNEETVYTSDKEEIKMPMAVIANGNTASAGELFTAALRDYKKATVVGENTYGKGSMQTVKSFNDGTGFKYTYRYYCPPFSDNYDGVGIAPDVEVKLSEEAAKKNVYLLSQSEDDQLRAAVESFK